jgi:hypothetical protein
MKNTIFENNWSDLIECKKTLGRGKNVPVLKAGLSILGIVIFWWEAKKKDFLTG